MTQPIRSAEARRSAIGFQMLRKGSSAGMADWDPKGCVGSRVMVTFLSHSLCLSPAV